MLLNDKALFYFTLKHGSVQTTTPISTSQPTCARANVLLTIIPSPKTNASSVLTSVCNVLNLKFACLVIHKKTIVNWSMIDPVNAWTHTMMTTPINNVRCAHYLFKGV